MTPQHKRIDSLLATHGAMPGSLLVTDVALVEAIWTLRSAFEQDKHAQSLAVRSLLGETAFAIEDRDAVLAALNPFEAGSCGFADCLVAAKHARQDAISPQASIEACASCRESSYSDLAERATLNSRCGLSHAASPQTFDLGAIVSKAACGRGRVP